VGGAPGSPSGIRAGAFTGAVLGALTGRCSKTVLLLTELRAATTASVSEVTMNRLAATVVAFDSMVAEPRGPKAVCEPMPPKAPAKSAALPLWSNTTMTRKRQITM